MRREYPLTREELLYYLDNYRFECNQPNPRFYMMEDSKWKRLLTDTTFGKDFSLVHDETENKIFVYIDAKTSYVFKSNAKASFGTYLNRVIQAKKEEKQVAKLALDEIAYCGTSGTSPYVYYDTISDYTGDVVINGDLTVNGKITENNKEEVNMKKFGLDFGRAKNVKMSMYGLAVKGANGSYVAYDRNNNVIVDVDIFNFDAEQYTFKMPVPISSLKAGDLIVHNGKMMYVQDVEEAFDRAIAAIDIAAGEDKLIRLTRNMFGFEYATKVVSLFDSMGNAPNAENPFGNMWMLALADGGSMDTSTLAMMMLMNGQPQTTESGFNPMMLLFMDKDNSKDNLLPLMMMMNMNK